MLVCEVVCVTCGIFPFLFCFQGNKNVIQPDKCEIVFFHQQGDSQVFNQNGLLSIMSIKKFEADRRRSSRLKNLSTVVEQYLKVMSLEKKKDSRHSR